MFSAVLRRTIIGLLLFPGFLGAQTPAPIVPVGAHTAPTEDKKIEEDRGNGTAGDKKKDDDTKKDEDKKKDGPDWYSIYGQGTIIPQGNLPFRSPYEGLNSLSQPEKYRSTATSTLFLIARPWSGTDIIFNPELAAGSGIGNPQNGTVGFGGFPNGEATRTGAPMPTPYIARALIRQTIGLGGEQEKIAEGPNELGGMVDINRIVIRVGKMSAGDVFDDNAYSHDPRTQFMNWGLMYNGAWDYPANVRGYTYGGAIEYNVKYWTFRYGIFAEPAIANGAPLDPHVLRANANTFEVEHRYKILERPGAISMLAYFNNAHMGSYRQALDEAAQRGTTPDVTTTREYRIKYGFGLNLEQELSENWGLFSRLGWNNGQTETWAFTEIDRTASVGIQVKGTNWKRPDDRLGVAYLVNGLSDIHRQYLAAGGYGFIVGDGKLNYAPEQIIETYYNFQIKKGLTLGLGASGVWNPGYNQDRGPVAIGTVRVHFEF